MKRFGLSRLFLSLKHNFTWREKTSKIFNEQFEISEECEARSISNLQAQASSLLQGVFVLSRLLFKPLDKKKFGYEHIPDHWQDLWNLF